MTRHDHDTTESRILVAGPPEAQRRGPGAGPDRVALLRRVWVDWLPPALVVLGVVLRLRQYAARRSLWNDEAALAINIVRRDYRELLEPLDIDQGAPLGFLWVLRTATNQLGNNEFALRLFPLLSGIAAVLLFAALARRVLSPWAVPPALLLFATLGPLVYYSAEAKQYSTDVAVTLLLLYATVRLLERPVTTRRAVAWGAVGCACLFVSHPSVLVLAACTAVAVVVLAVRGGFGALVPLAPGAGIWVAGLACLYVVSLRHLAANPSLEAFWQDGYAPQPLRPGTALPWVGRVVAGMVPNPVDMSPALLVLALAVVGTVALVRRHHTVGLLLLAVDGGALAAGLLAIYPLRWRLALYLVPVVLLAVAAAVDAFSAGKGGGLLLRMIVAAGLVIVTVRPARDAASAVVHPYTLTEVRTVLEHLRAASEPTDGVYVHWTAAVVYEYYAPVLRLPPLAGYFSFATQASPCSTDDPLAAARAHPRVWVVFAFPPMYDPADNAETGLSQFDRLGARIDGRAAPGDTRAVLYDTRPGPVPAAPRSPRPGDCFTVVSESR